MRCIVRVVRLCLLIIASLTSSASFSYGQQSTIGNCNVTLGPEAEAESIVLNCLPSDQEVENLAPLTLKIATEGLKPGTAEFFLVLENLSDEVIALIVPAWLSMQDGRGIPQTINCLRSGTNCVQQLFVFPGSITRLKIILEQTISVETTSMSFLLKNLTYVTPKDALERPLGFVRWTSPIESGQAIQKCREELTCEDKARIQITLDELGYKPGRTDGVFDATTRRAIVAWQSADSDNRFEAATGCLTHADTLKMKVRGVRRAFDPIEYDASCRRTEAHLSQSKPESNVPKDLTSTAPTSEQIKSVQKELKRSGLYVSVIDGVWGRGSASALIAAQKRMGVAPTGELHDGLAMLNKLKRLSSPIDCFVRFNPFRGVLYEKPAHIALKIGDVPRKQFRVLDQRPGTFYFWFQINVNGRIGWIKDFRHLKVTGSECRR